MRFIEYLNEQENSIQEIFKKIEKDCKPFLKELTKHSLVDDLLYSGRKKKFEGYFKGKVRKDRKPKDMPEEVHNWLDDWFEDKFGVRARSQSLFTIPKGSIAAGYGTPYAIFPIGNYKIIWSPEIEDLYSVLIESGNINWDLLNRDYSESDMFIEQLENAWEDEYGSETGNGWWELDMDSEVKEYSGSYDYSEVMEIYGYEIQKDFEWFIEDRNSGVVSDRWDGNDFDLKDFVFFANNPFNERIN